MIGTTIDSQHYRESPSRAEEHWSQGSDAETNMGGDFKVEDARA